MSKIFRVSANTLKLIEEFECGGNFSQYMKAYKCPAGRWTIGMGTTRYPNGKLVMPGDEITEHQLFEYVTHDLKTAEQTVSHSVTAPINQAQFDALVDFVYNLGSLAFQNSTLLKVINNNPQDPAIEKQFLRWNKAAGVPLQGLTRRRRAEAYLYFNGTLKFNFDEN
jgi:lysozyme